MVDKMQLATEHPEPAPDAKTLIGTLLRRNLLWVTLIKQKLVPFMIPTNQLTYGQARTYCARFQGYL